MIEVTNKGCDTGDLDNHLMYDDLIRQITCSSNHNNELATPFDLTIRNPHPLYQFEQRASTAQLTKNNFYLKPNINLRNEYEGLIDVNSERGSSEPCGMKRVMLNTER